MALSSVLGYPRIGQQRELKKATEAYWAKQIDGQALLDIAKTLCRQRWQTQKAAGIDLIPSNDFSLYDHVLDMAVLVGATPARYRTRGSTELDQYFAMARGVQTNGTDLKAMEMTKWFDTNYHYIVPEFSKGQTFTLDSTKPFDEFQDAKALGIVTKPVLLGPISFLLLGKTKAGGVDRWKTLLPKLLPVYAHILQRLSSLGAEWIQLDEPCVVLDRTTEDLQALTHAYQELAKAKGSAKLLLQTYFGRPGESLETLVNVPVDALGVDAVEGWDDIERLLSKGFPHEKRLAVGIVDGRNIWINDLSASLKKLERIAQVIPGDRLIVGSSCSLLHVPHDTALETTLDPQVHSWLAFANQKLQEVALLATALNGGKAGVASALQQRRQILEARRTSTITHHPEVRDRLGKLTPKDDQRKSPFAVRRATQRQALNLPPFPTTTIGSFTQTPEVRQKRADWKRGTLDDQGYESFLKQKTKEIMEFQERVGLDILVHGEFERNDMVEYFAEQLKGFLTTTHGWVQSYGSRYVKPPIIYGDVWRPAPMTVKWATYAQSFTSKPVKGMLTGPVTILKWAFVRDDQPKGDTCKQIALAIRDEVHDLEAAGIRIIQIDEPAIREGLPLRRSEWDGYFAWAVTSFRLASVGVRDQTQIHTHMCYSEFSEILQAIREMDADVLSIENSRSDLELLETFRTFRYDHEIGPGVYDVHSPRVPSVEEIVNCLALAAKVLGPDLLWVNPDCGLKTRPMADLTPSLENMVKAAKLARETLVK